MRQAIHHFASLQASLDPTWRSCTAWDRRLSGSSRNSLSSTSWPGLADGFGWVQITLAGIFARPYGIGHRAPGHRSGYATLRGPVADSDERLQRHDPEDRVVRGDRLERL